MEQENQTQKITETVTLQTSQSAAIMRPAATLASVIESQKERNELIQKSFIEKIHFGKIPGTDKPTLYQNGAASVTGWYLCYPQYKILSEEHDPNRVNEYFGNEWKWDQEAGRKVKQKSKTKQTSTGYHVYRIECQIVHRGTGQIVGTGVGACATSEEKYISRPNDLENTILKMAKKRAFVDAALITFSLGELFTQDVEDLPEDFLNYGSDRQEPKGQPQPKKQAPKQQAQPKAAPPKEEPAEEEETDFDITRLMADNLVTISSHSGKNYMWAKSGKHWGANDLVDLGFTEYQENGKPTGKYVTEIRGRAVNELNARAYGASQ